MLVRQQTLGVAAFVLQEPSAHGHSSTVVDEPARILVLTVAWRSSHRGALAATPSWHTRRLGTCRNGCRRSNTPCELCPLSSTREGVCCVPAGSWLSLERVWTKRNHKLSVHQPVNNKSQSSGQIAAKIKVVVTHAARAAPLLVVKLMDPVLYTTAGLRSSVEQRFSTLPPFATTYLTPPIRTESTHTTTSR
jgi:hypothetical protein